jgi:predicted alpha/beta-fold hydrolase
LVHGLQGSSASSYVLGIAAKLFAAGWHVVRLNQRGCGPSEVMTPTWNHAGRSDDLAAVLEQLREGDGVLSFALAGFSLGGNLVLKLLGERGGAAPAGLVAAAALSPLVDPAMVQNNLDQPALRPFRLYFLHRFARSMQRRAALFPEHFARMLRGGAAPAEHWRKLTVRQFDDRFTAPLSGFASAAEYYRRVDALPLVGAIRVPTLLVHAKDDPFVPFAVYRGSEVTRTPSVRPLFPERGGHLGFYDSKAGTDGYWVEDCTVAFFGAALAARHQGIAA